MYVKGVKGGMEGKKKLPFSKATPLGAALLDKI